MTNAQEHLVAMPTDDATLPRRPGDFPTLTEALEYAGRGKRGFNFYSARGELTDVLPFATMHAEAVRLGKKITGFGLKKGDRVAIIAETSPDFINFFFACQYAGVWPTPLPLPTSFGQREGYVNQLAQQMESCDATIVITPEYMKDLVEAAALQVKSIKFCGTSEELSDKVEKNGEIFSPEPDDISYLQYSSGSTRFPHGVIVTHKMLMTNCDGIGSSGVIVKEGDRAVSWLPFYHDMGLVGTLLASLSCQVTTDFIATEDFARRPMTWLKLISENRGTITYSPTFGYDICTRRVSESVLAELDLSTWRIAGIGADMIQPDVMAAFAERFAPAGYRQTTFVPSYGLAECTLAVSFMPLDTGIITDRVDERILSGELTIDDLKDHEVGEDEVNGVHATREVVNCGTPLPSFTIEIRDNDGQVLSDKRIGRVFVSGDSVMIGYYKDDEATNAVLAGDGWLDTGDMGYMKDGCIYIVGRVKDMIIINGKNHWPQDIEWAVEQLDGIRAGDSAAISIPGEKAEEVPLVIVQCRYRDQGERHSLVEDIKTKVQHIAGVNCRVELVPPRSLPRTSSGKLSRAKTRAKFLSGELPSLSA